MPSLAGVGMSFEMRPLKEPPAGMLCSVLMCVYSVLLEGIGERRPRRRSDTGATVMNGLLSLGKCGAVRAGWTRRETDGDGLALEAKLTKTCA